MRVASLVGLLVMASTLCAADTTAVVSSSGWIAFDERVFFKDGGDAWEVSMVRPDGTGERMVTPRHPALDNMSAAWSPGGSRIAFTGQTLAQHVPSGIFVINVDGSGWHLVATAPSRGRWPPSATWSPDGLRIAFSRRGSIWTASASGGDEQRLTQGRTDHQPAWSPDGVRIAFARGGGLWIVQTSSGKSRSFAANGSNPSWSPDGRTLAFENGVGRIVLIKRDGTHRNALGWGHHPSWSPDGRMIVYDGGNGIYVMDRNGRNVHRVRKGFLETGRPAWGR